MGKSSVTGRFAPSPTGRMHLGNVFAALLSWLSARSQGGEWILRIEDLDGGRCREEYIEALKDDLRFLGLDWDRGGEGEYCQSRRGKVYEDCLAQLEAKGLTYPCWCTRAELMATQAPHESDGRMVYAGTCRDNAGRQRLFAGKPAAVRIRVPDEEVSFVDGHYGLQTVNLAANCGDFVLRRSDGAWAYQLAVAVDDALMGVTEVVRGRDLLLSAAQQKYLLELLGLPVPSYSHFPLLCAPDGKRLSKRDRDLDMGELRKRYGAEEILGRLACCVGLIDRSEAISATELQEIFSWEKIGKDDIII